MWKTPILGISGQNSQFWPFLYQNGQNCIFSKKRLEHFLRLKALFNCKVSEKSNEGIPRKMWKTSIHLITLHNKRAVLGLSTDIICLKL